MLEGQRDETIELECPECGARIEATAKDAESGRVRCPRGHEVLLMGMMGELDGGASGKRG